MGVQWFGDRVQKYVDDRFEAKAMAAGRRMEQVARNLAPVKTGALKRSIGFFYERSTRTLTLYAHEPYALFQEFGTRFHGPHPFLRPALLAAAPGFFSGISTNISVSASISPHHVPGKLHGKIRQHIAMANARLNRGAVRRAALGVFHPNHENIRLSPGGGLRGTPARSNLSKLHKIRKAWN